MRNHKVVYNLHFGIKTQQSVWDELEWVLFCRMTPAHDIHHIYGRGKNLDEIENLMALTRDNHTLAHKEQYSKKTLSNIHKQFMEDNPYKHAL